MCEASAEIPCLVDTDEIWYNQAGQRSVKRMKREIATGIQDFEKLRINHAFYIDKTDFIREWWNGRDDVTLITRPRRFGKTLNMSTLNCFFSNKFENRPELFEGLKVWKDPDIREQQGKWPVIFLTFAGIKGTTYSTVSSEIVDISNNRQSGEGILNSPFA